MDTLLFICVIIIMNKLMQKYCKFLGNNLDEAIIKHISNFKFSNRDYLKKPSSKISFQKIINNTINKKYGICIELNYIFTKYLEKNNHNYYYVKCLIPKNKYEFYNTWHLAIVIVQDNLKFFVDVGSGNYFDKPIQINNDNYVELYSDKNKLIYKIINKPVSQNEIKRNYVNYCNIVELPIRKIKYNRIYDLDKKSYVNF